MLVDPGAYRSQDYVSIQIEKIRPFRLTYHGICLVFMILTIKKTNQKNPILHYEFSIKALCTTLYLFLHSSVLTQFIVMHSYAAWFSKKCVFMKVSTFTSRTKQIYTKTLKVLSTYFQMTFKNYILLMKTWFYHQEKVHHNIGL